MVGAGSRAEQTGQARPSTGAARQGSRRRRPGRGRGTGPGARRGRLHRTRKPRSRTHHAGRKERARLGKGGLGGSISGRVRSQQLRRRRGLMEGLVDRDQFRARRSPIWRPAMAERSDHTSSSRTWPPIRRSARSFIFGRRAPGNRDRRNRGGPERQWNSSAA